MNIMNMDMDIGVTVMTNEQKLVDICFSIALTIKTNKKYFGKLSYEETADWVAKQLDGCGFPTTPCGSSWGILIKDKNEQT